MAGIMRLVEGVIAVDSPLGVVPGTYADDEMAKIDGVSVALQLETLTNNGSNQIAGAESAWGLPVTAVGVNTNWYKILEDPILNGHTSVAFRSNGNGLRIAANPLRAFPKSYLIVLIGSFTPEVLAGTFAQMLMVGVPASNTATKVSTRFFGGNLVFSPDSANTSVFMSRPLSTTFTANTPTILGVQWNNDTHTGKIYVNDFETPISQNTNLSVSSPTPVEGDHWDFMYGGNGNVGAAWGNHVRAFVVDSAIMDDPAGKQQMLQVVENFKAVYGIA